MRDGCDPVSSPPTLPTASTAGAMLTNSPARALDRLHLKAVVGPISGFVQRGEMMIERMQALREQRNSKGFRREALRLRDAAAKLENKRLVKLTEQLAEAPDDDQSEVELRMQQLQQRLNHIMNYSVRGVLVHNTLTELAEDLRIAAKSDDRHTVQLQLAKAASEFQQLSDYISIGNSSSDDMSSADASPEELHSEELQCKTIVAGCVSNGKEMLDSMTREQANGTLHHSVACRLIVDTFVDVVADLGQAAESDEMQAVAPRVDRVNSRFFHVTDLVARNKMVAGLSETASPAMFVGVAAPPVPVEPTSAQPTTVINQAMAIQQFGGDTNFFRRMSVKFIASGRSVVDRLVAAVSCEAKDINHVDLRRDAHSLKGAAATIGALQLSQAALDLQLAIEADAKIGQLRDLAGVIAHQFELVEKDLSPIDPHQKANNVSNEEDLTSIPPEPKDGSSVKVVIRKSAGRAERANAVGKDTMKAAGGVRRLGAGPAARAGAVGWGGGVHGRR